MIYIFYAIGLVAFYAFALRKSVRQIRLHSKKRRRRLTIRENLGNFILAVFWPMVLVLWALLIIFQYVKKWTKKTK